MDDNYLKEFNGSGDSFGPEHLKKRNLPASHSSEEIGKAVERCLLSSSSALDVSRKNIQHLTEEIYRVPSIKYFYLERNVISRIPEDLFQKLPHLVWLDLRYNEIKALPPGIGYHRQLKTLLLERNPIKELPTELGNLTSLTALNLRDCPLEFPPKEVVQKGLKSILCFLRDSGRGELLCMEPATPEMPPVEKLNLSELSRCSLDESDEWPNEEEKLRFQRLKEEIVKAETGEFLAAKPVGATQDFMEARKRDGKEQRCLGSAALCRAVRAERAGNCRWEAEKELKEEEALFEQRKSNKEWLQERGSQAVMVMEEEKETFRFSPTNADAVPKPAPCAAGAISDCTVTEGAEKRRRTPDTMEEGVLKVGDGATREKKLDQRVKQQTQMMGARGEK